MSSWLRTAVTKAAEVSGGTNLTRTVKSYAGSVIYHAAEGAKIIQDRIGVRTFQSFRVTVKRLDELSISCKGIERVQLLRRWLVALKEVDRFSACTCYNELEGNEDDHLSFDEQKGSPKQPTLVYYVDNELGGEPMNFREVFLHSRALEGITLSTILEPPNEEEASLLLELFRLCLEGGKDTHNAMMISLQNLAIALSNYRDEVLVKREEVLQFAQNAISGLKINADQARIDAEASNIMEKLEEMQSIGQRSSGDCEKSVQELNIVSIEAVEEASIKVQLYSRLESLLLKKRSSRNGDTPEFHSEKVEKLKILSESLTNSTSKAEKRIIDNRFQKEEALNFRATRSDEVGQLEKDLEVEIGQLERRKDELEDELKKVNSLLAAAQARLRNAKEERDHFDEASNQIIIHLKLKEDDLLRTISSYRIEGDVVTACINLLEDAWNRQTFYTEQKEDQVSDELEKYAEYFVDAVVHLLSAYKEQLESTLTRIRELAENMRATEGSEKVPNDEKTEDHKSRKNIEKEYLDLESKLVTVLSIVDDIKSQFSTPNEAIQRRYNGRIKELFVALEKTREEFESTERLSFEVETPLRRPQTPASAKMPQTSRPASKWGIVNTHKQGHDAAWENLRLELEEDGRDIQEEESGEIVDWEFDAFERRF